MSTELGEVKNCVHPEESIDVAVGTGGIRIMSTCPKMWLDEDGVNKFIEFLETAKQMKGYGNGN